MNRSRNITLDENTLYDEINVVPMLDLAYVLLVIFIILTTVAVQGMKVNLPDSQSRTELADINSRTITLLESGGIFLDGVPVTRVQLENVLQQDVAAQTETSIVVKAAGTVPYQRIIFLLDLAEKIGVTKIGLATQLDSRDSRN